MMIKKWLLYLLPLCVAWTVHAQTATTTAKPTAAPAPATAPAPAATAPTPAAAPAETAPAPAAPASHAKAPFPATLEIGGITWKLGNQQEDKNVILAEYVTNNEKVDNWNQLVTFQKFRFNFPKEVTPEKFAEGEFAQLKKQGYKLKTNIVEKSPTEAIMEFRIESPVPEQQDELQRIIKTPSDEVLVFHYVIKKSDMGDAERSKWIAALKGLSFPFLLKAETPEPQT